MNQCSTVFFDRTKPEDERPEVLDIFANALSHVVRLSDPMGFLQSIDTPTYAVLFERVSNHTYIVWNEMCIV